MDDELLGYLQGAMQPAEREAFERRLAVDDELRRRCELIRESLREIVAAESPVLDRHPAFDPPAGLARRTCEFVAQLRAQEAAIFFSAKGAARGRKVAVRAPAEPAYVMGAVADEEAGRRWRLSDWVTVGGLALAASLLLFPGLAAWRYQRHVTACQERMHRLGTALVDYSRKHGDVFPEVPLDGPLSHAGIYAPRLLEAGLIRDASDVICPGSALSAEAVRVPRLEELQRADAAQEAELAARMGGGYGYALGYVEDGKYHAVRNLNRANFAVLADAPSHGTSDKCALGSLNHGCGGQNVLFEDGHAEFLNRCKLQRQGDELFRNAAGFVGAGIGRDDVVIGASEARPLLKPAVDTSDSSPVR